MRALLLTLFCCTIVGLGAQENKKYLLIEHFTNTHCPICASRNPGIYSTMNKFDPADLHHFSIHPSVPYNSCPFYQFNKDANQFREWYYSVRSTPTLFINGSGSSTNPATFENNILTRLGQTSPLSIAIEGGSNRNLEVVISIKTHGQIPQGDLRLFVALVERYKMFKAGNNESDHYNIYRRPISDLEGDPFSPAPVGSVVTKNYTYTIPQGVAADQAYVLAYVQNMDTREVLNSGASYDQVFTTVKEDEDDVVFRIFPNPVEDEIWVTTMEKKILNLRLYDLYGRLIKTFPVSQGSEQTSIPIGELIPGVYALELENTDGRYIKRIVKK